MNKIFLAIIIMSLFSCTKGGTGGEAKINFKVFHHEQKIPNAVVYIKYDTKDFPGEDIGNYDASYTSSAEATGSIENLKKGNYYVYGVGYDSAIAQIVKGGVSFKINKKDAALDITVPVTEGD